MKILTDFDGVLTDLASEARRVRSIFEDELGRLTDVGQALLTQVLGRAEAAMVAEPHRHGWRVNGRITAFSNEDGFIQVNGLAACLDDLAKNDVTVRYWRSQLNSKGIADFPALAQASYLQMAAETAAGQLHPIDERAAESLKRLIADGVQIVVVSNSGTERICQILSAAGLQPEVHDPSKRQGPLRVRGGARKFMLGREPKILPVGPYAVELDRPHYEAILMEERPDVVIGDVFSLDLALPLAMAREGRALPRNARLVLRRRPYTPAWSAAFLESAPTEEIRCELADTFA